MKTEWKEQPQTLKTIDREALRVVVGGVIRSGGGRATPVSAGND